MNTIQLECFVAVAEHMNFSRASEALRITQPAVSHQIQSLEEELNVKLFKRTSKSVVLTQEGILFLPDAELILKTALSARERLGRHEHFISFDLGCHNSMELDLLPPVLEKLSEHFPNLHPNIRLVPFPSLLGLIENKQLHAALGIKEERKKSSLIFKELFSAPICCICTPSHPLARHKTVTREQLSGNFIACSPRQIAGPVFSLQNRIVSKLRPEQCYFVESIESALTLVKAQIGYTLYPDLTKGKPTDLKYIPVSNLSPVSFGVYYRNDNDHPVMKKFLNLLGT